MDLEQYFNIECLRGMSQFELNKFKKDFPTLYSCIISSMGVAFAEGLRIGKQGENLIDKRVLNNRILGSN